MSDVFVILNRNSKSVFHVLSEVAKNFEISAALAQKTSRRYTVLEAFLFNSIGTFDTP